MARRVTRGEIWMVGLGMAAKPRPCLILSVPFRDDEKAVVTNTPGLADCGAAS